MSVEKQEEILDMVRRQLQRTNPPDTEALYGRAARIDEGIKDLTLRQFNARYPLRVRREMAREEKADEEERAPQEEPAEAYPGADREVVRTTLLDFARAVAEVPQGPELVDLIGSGVEEYVDRIAVAARDQS